MSETMQPVGPYIILEEVNQKVDMIGDIHIPDIVQEETTKFKVTGIGTGLDDMEFPVKVGDFVIASRKGGTITKRQGKESLQVKVSNLIAQFDNEEDTVPMKMFEPHILIYPIPHGSQIIGGIIVGVNQLDTPKYKVYNGYEGCDLVKGDEIITLNATISSIGKQVVYTTMRDDVICIVESEKIL